MKVLWFAVTPSMYAPNNTSHNGGGWIASLEALMKEAPNMKLGIAFEHADTCFRVERSDVTYYPISVWKSRWQRLKRMFIYKTEERLLIPACLKIIDDFKPDVIHVFGSEWCFGLVTTHTNIPVVIHMQGSIPSYYNARFPAGYNAIDLILYNGFDIIKTVLDLFNERHFKLRAKREEKILCECHNFMGRTEWDKNITQLFSPNSQYFYCSEALREQFIDLNDFWHLHRRTSLVLITTISSALYKGGDLILKTAKLLKENTDVDFEWRVFGITELKFHEWKTKINVSDVGVRLMGTFSAKNLKDELLNADIFIHPSYIDNSPNSVCEAQILGLPVICTNVGGISSIVKHNETGLLVPANDPYTLASYIISLIKNENLSTSLAKRAREVALKRHNPKSIVSRLLDVYNEIIQNNY